MSVFIEFGGGGGGGGTPGGSDTQVQFNDAGSFGGSSNFTWNNARQALTLTAIAGGSFDVLDILNADGQACYNFYADETGAELALIGHAPFSGGITLSAYDGETLGIRFTGPSALIQFQYIDSGISFQGTVSPITIKGGDDDFGDSAILFENTIDNYIVLSFIQDTSLQFRTSGSVTSLFPFSITGQDILHSPDKRSTLTFSTSGVILETAANVVDIDSGRVDFSTGPTTGIGWSGLISFSTGQAGGSGQSGDILFQTGPTSGAGASGQLLFATGIAAVGDSGSIVFQVGTAAGTTGNFIFTTIPAADPGVPGALYHTVGALFVSL